MTIHFATPAERRIWLRLLELDGDRCWERARRRRERAAARQRPPAATADARAAT
jgi:hypothetical protein